VVRYNTDGSLDSSFNGTGSQIEKVNGGAVGVALQSDGSIVAAVNITDSEFPIPGYFDLLRDTASGALNSEVRTPIGVSNDISTAVAVQSDDKIVLAGYSLNGNTSLYNFALVRYNSDGSIDTGFNSTGKVTTAIGSGNAQANCVAIQSDGRILVAGYSYNGTINVFTVARYEASGSLVTITPANSSFTNKNEPVVSGEADPDSTVDVALDGTSAGSTIASGSGTWSFMPGNPLSDGTYTVSATEVDGTGGIVEYSNTNTFTVDTVPPLAPVIQTPVNGAFTNVAIPFVSGSAEANSTVTIYLDGTDSGITTASGTGAWSFEPAAPLVSGTHTVEATATDLAGNTSAFSSTNTFIISSTTAGTPGTLDPSFGSGGVVTTAIAGSSCNANSMVVQPDGKIVVVGNLSPYNGISSVFAVLRYNPDGTLDTTFGGTGRVTTSLSGYIDNAQGVALQSDGKIVVAGYSYNGSENHFGVVRYNTDGTLDTSFGPAGTGEVVTQAINGSAYAVAIQADGKIVVAGNSYSTELDFAVARYNADGTLDSTFGTGGLTSTNFAAFGLPNYAYSIALQTDGKIVVSGMSKLYGAGGYSTDVVRYNTDGSLDSSFNGTGSQIEEVNGGAVGVALQSDGSIVAAVNVTDSEYPNPGYFDLIRDTPSGALNLNFHVSFGISNDISTAVAVQSDGKIVLAGYSLNGNTNLDNFALVRYNSDGSVDTGFNSTGKVTTAIGSGNAQASCVAIQSDGRILAAGYSFNGTTNVFTVARYFGASEPPIAITGPATTVAKTSATLTGTVNANSLATTAYFQYGLDTTYGSVTGTQSIGSASTPQNVTAVLNNLAPNTTYHYQLVAVNSATLFGGTTYGLDSTFTTAPDPPVDVTAAAVSVTSTSATLASVVFPNGRLTTAYFEYGLTTAYGNTTPVQTIPAGTGAVNVLAPITGLTPDAVYHYTIIANNSGTPYPIQGLDQMFLAADPPPTVSTGAPSEITTTSALLGGVATANSATAQVYFDYGTNGVNFPISISANPGTISGTTPVPVTGTATNLEQATTYYYRIRAVNDGGTTIGSVNSFSIGLLSGLTQVFPGAPPPNDGYLFVSIAPQGLAGEAWRFVGEQTWRAPGIPLGGLPTGDFYIEFRAVPGYIEPQPQLVQINSGSEATQVNAEYYQTSVPTNDGINVTLEPKSITTGTNPAQWELVGDDGTNWHDSGATIGNLSAGVYLLEFKPLPGETTPAIEAVAVPAADGSPIVTATAAYFLSGTPAGTTPAPLPYASIVSGTGLPYAFVGQIRSDDGEATGFVVLDRVVATAGHVVFDDATLSYTTGLQWLFQREAGTYEPVPLTPSGSYVLDGYAAQRITENTPGSSTPQSQDLDAAAMFFMQEAGPSSSGTGAYSGYLASDSSANEFLLSPALMTLVGYPVDGIPSVNQGEMFATPRENIGFSLEEPAEVDGTTGVPYRLYTTTDITAPGGMSGGPLCVQFQGGTYYPAAIYLGGNGDTVVRAIDSNVVTLFTAAEASGYGGPNHVGGGVIYVGAYGTEATSAEGGMTVTLGPPGAVAADAGWRLGTTDGFQASGDTLSNLTAGTYVVTFAPVARYETPAPQNIKVESGEVATFQETYTPLPPSISTITSSLVATGTEGTAFSGYQITATHSPTAFTASSLPSGIVMSDSTHGVIAGTPLVSGSYASTIQAINASGTDTRTLTFYIAPEITSSEITSATEGQPFSYQITTGSDDVITSLDFGGILPNGITSNPALGNLAGTPQAPGLLTLTMSAAGAGGVNTEPLTLLVNAPGVAGVVLSVSEDGAGTVTNLTTSQTLQLPAQLVGISGSSYQLQAIAGAGSFFGGWQGGIVSDANPLGGTLTGNLSIGAVFSTYASAKGSYAGLIATTPATIGQAGSVQLTLNAKGGYTGKMLYGGVTYTLKGAFDQTGSSTPVVKHGAAVGPAVQLHLETVTGSPQITGSVPGASDAALLAKKAAFTKAQPFDKPGRYTALIQSGTDSDSPQGIGYGALTVSTLGNISFAGVLNDGTKVSLASTISADQTWPFYASPYKSTKFNDSSLKSGGFISGWVTFLEQTGTSEFNGVLDWGKTQTTDPKAIYPSGFQTQTALIGSLYELKHGESILDFPDTTNNALLTFGFTPSLSGTITISPRNTVVAPVPDKLTLKFNLTDGLFSGRVMEDGSLSPYGGAVFQTGTYGGGLILSGTTSDPVMLDPSP
jgi:uncharacterized delta-60 repeat protein